MATLVQPHIAPVVYVGSHTFNYKWPLQRWERYHGVPQKKQYGLIVTADVHHAHVEVQLVQCLDRCTSAKFSCEASR